MIVRTYFFGMSYTSKRKTNPHKETSTRIPKSKLWQFLKKKKMTDTTELELEEMIELW
jgi:hypothetical protein